MMPSEQIAVRNPAALRWLFAIGMSVALSGCSSELQGDAGFKTPANFPYHTLSEYGFFEGAIVDLAPVQGVVPYQVISPLWADHAGKSRYIVLPEGEQVVADGPEDWDYPDGTVIIKTFFYSTDKRRADETATPIETRLMIKEAADWKGHTYIWNDTLTDAVRKVSGKRVQLSFADEAGETTTQEYIVPNTNQCKDCHERDHLSRPLGLVSRQLNRPVERDGVTVSQLDWLNEKQIFASPLLPMNSGHLVDPFGDAPVAERARAYLDSNCSHCHRDGGNGGPSGLVLLAQETFPRAYGVCKGPVAAGDGTGGFYNDILPGHPEESIIVHRMKSTDPEIKMPEIPNRLPHQAGIELVSEWIRQMPEMSCD